MLKARREAVVQVAERLFAAEKAIDAALSAAAQLSAIMPIARNDANLAAVVGQEAIESAAESFTALVRARQQMVATHQRLDETKKQIGLTRMDDLGGGMGKVLTGPTGHLSVVEKAA